MEAVSGLSVGGQRCQRAEQRHRFGQVAWQSRFRALRRTKVHKDGNSPNQPFPWVGILENSDVRPTLAVNTMLANVAVPGISCASTRSLQRRRVCAAGNADAATE